jgi:hypothetical protein
MTKRRTKPVHHAPVSWGQREAAVFAALDRDERWRTLKDLAAAVDPALFADRRNPASKREAFRIVVRSLELRGRVEVQRPGRGNRWRVRLRPVQKFKPQHQRSNDHETPNAIAERR